MADIIFGNVQHPPFLDRLIPDLMNRAWDNLGQRTVKGVVWHRQQGSNRGTEAYFSTLPPNQVCPAVTDYRYGGCNGLTDFGIDNWTGEIRRWNDPTGAAHGVGQNRVSANRSGWASGPWRAGAFGDGRAFVEDHGGDTRVINRDQASIEIAGNFGDPISEAGKDAVAALTAYWADQAGISWDAFPIIPGKDYSFVRHHQEFRGFNRNDCPGAVVIDATDDLIERTRAILKRAQTAVVTPPAKPEPAWWPADYSLAGLIEQFGRVTRVHPDGRTTEGGFSPGGVVSDAWVWRGKVAGLAMAELPRPVAWYTHAPAGEGQIDVLVFRKGWRFGNLGGGWGWLDQ